MSDGAEELPPVVAALTGDDASFLEMLERDIAALEQFREDMTAALSGTGAGEGAAAGAQGLATQLEQAAAEGSDAAATEIVDTLTAAGQEGGAALSEGVSDGAVRSAAALDEIAEAQASMFESLGAMTRDEFAAAREQAVEAREEYEQIRAEIEQYAEYAGLPVHRDDAAVFDAVTAGALTAQQAVARLTGAEQEQAAASAVAERALVQSAAAAAAAAPPVERLYEAINAMAGAEVEAGDPAVALREHTEELIAANADLAVQMLATAEAEAAAVPTTEALIAAQAELGVQMLATAEADVVAAAEFAANMRLRSTALTTAMLAGDGADEVIARFGTSEAHAAVTTASLGAATEQLAFQNEVLIRTYTSLRNGGSADLTWLQRDLADLAAAQQAVTDSAAGLVAAQNGVNLAVIQNQTAFLDEASALSALQAAADAAGVDVGVLAADLEEGAYAALGAAAADARQALEADALALAQQRLAAANLTLVETWTRLAAGEDIAAEQQSAALASVAAAEREVTSLTASTAGAASEGERAMARFGGGMGMASMGAWMLIGYLPQVVGWLDKIGTYDRTGLGVQNVQEAMLGLSSGMPALNSGLQGMVATLGAMQASFDTVFTGNVSQGIKDIDSALAQLYQTDPQLAAEQAAAVTATLEKSGVSSKQAAADLTTYNQAVASSAIQLAAEQHAVEDTIPGTQTYADAVQAASIRLENNALAARESADALRDVGYQVMATEASVGYMNTALDAAQIQMRQQALTSAQASVGLLQLGVDQQTLNYQLIDAEQSYSESTSEANAYGAALTALSGTTNTLLGSEAAFTTSLGQLDTAVKANGTSLDVSNTKGAANVTMFTQVADAADKAATAVYQNEVNTKGSTQAYQDANQKLEEEKQAFIDAADKAGFNKDKVKALADELYQLPPSIDIPITADTQQAMRDVSGLLEWIDKQSGAVTLYENSAGEVWSPTGGNKARAEGGPVTAGETYLIGENGPEFMTFGADGFITPNDMIRPMLLSAGSSGPTSAGSSGAVVYQLSFNFYPGVMLGDEMAFTDAIQQAMGRLGTVVPDQYASIQTTRGRG